MGSRESAFFQQAARYFELIGPPAPHEAEHALDILGERPVSNRRLAQIKILSASISRNREPVHTAFTNYTFLDVDRCNQCASLAKITMFRKTKGTWKTESRFLSGPNPTITVATFTDLSGDGVRELLVEVGGGVNAWSQTTLYVFDITGPDLDLLCELPIQYDSANSGFEWLKYEKKLDFAKTRATGGSHLVFRVATYTKGRVRLPSPGITEERVPMKRPTR